jgi:tetratricopeptide (TPR) repeat protein
MIEMSRMFRKRKGDEPAQLPIPKELPELEGLDQHSDDSWGSLQDAEGATEPKRPLRTWLWTLLSATIVVLLIGYVVIMAVMGVYDGLKDRALENQEIAREHYALGLQHLQAGDYERAIGEFELALRHDSSLSDARDHLREAKEQAEAQATPTSETRLDAVKALYREAVVYYENGSLTEAVTALEDLHGLDPEYQSENVITMMAKAHYQLGLNAVAEDRLDEATSHFNTVLDLEPENKEAQSQLDLISLYSAALNYWERDWPATIQALKGLYALAPDYKDVEIRLHDAYVFRGRSLAEQGNWCQAGTQYQNAVEILPLESTVDAPTSMPTARATTVAPVTTTPGGSATAVAAATGQPTGSAQNVGDGRIVFTSYDAARQRHDIYMVDLAQGNARLLQTNASQPALSPDGGLLAFHNLDPDQLGIAILDLRSNTMSQVTGHPEDSTPSWSGDGQQIVFASNKHGDRKWRLYAISPGEVGGEGEEWVFGRMPAWSADGSRIAYQGCDVHGDNCAIWVIQPGGLSPMAARWPSSQPAPATGRSMSWTLPRAKRPG